MMLSCANSRDGSACATRPRLASTRLSGSPGALWRPRPPASRRQLILEVGHHVLHASGGPFIRRTVVAWHTQACPLRSCQTVRMVALSNINNWGAARHGKGPNSRCPSTPLATDTTFRGGTTSSSASAAASRAPVLGRTLKSRRIRAVQRRCQKRQLIQRKPHIGSGTLPKLEPRCCRHSTPAPHPQPVELQPSTLLRTQPTTVHLPSAKTGHSTEPQRICAWVACTEAGASVLGSYFSLHSLVQKGARFAKKNTHPKHVNVACPLEGRWVWCVQPNSWLQRARPPATCERRPFGGRALTFTLVPRGPARNGSSFQRARANPCWHHRFSRGAQPAVWY